MRTLFFYFIALLLGCGCASSRQPAAVIDNRPLMVGDCILIYFGEDDHMCSVDSFGDISLPILGKVHVVGLTLEQTKEQLEHRFVPTYEPWLYISLKRCQ